MKVSNLTVLVNALSCPALPCPAGQDTILIIVLSCRSPGQTMTGRQDRTEKVVLCSALAQMKDRTK